MIYKNCSGSSRTFYGVTFAPGDEKYVPGYINHPKFVRLENFSEPETVSTDTTTKRSSRSKKSIKEMIADGSDSN